MSRSARRFRRDDLDLVALTATAARHGVLHVGNQRTALGLGELTAVELDPISSVVSRSAIAQLLASIELDQQPGAPSPRLHLAVPFLPGEPGCAWLAPIQITASADGGIWVTLIADERPGLQVLEAELDALQAGAEQKSTGDPGLLSVEEDPDAAVYGQMVNAALEEISAGRLRKVVLSRSVHLTATMPLDAASVLERMADREPSCVRYAHPSGTSRVVGASPELVVERQGRQISSHPLAGTIGLSDGRDGGMALARSAKDLEEHRLVVDDIVGRLDGLVEKLSVPSAPRVVELRAVAHLGTAIEAELPAGSPVGLIDLLAAIHPTPAVGGVPTSEALSLISSLEAPRGDFAGSVGWIDAEGDGIFHLAIRGASLSAERATIRAGAGIVAGSTSSGEIEETRVKLASIIEAVVPGASARLEALSSF